jgi:hypothetical protein
MRDRRRVHLPVHRRTFISEPLRAFLLGPGAFDGRLGLILYPSPVRCVLGGT